MTDHTTAPAGVVSSTELGHEPRWYCLSADGMATLCVDEEDAKEVAAESWVMYPQNAPYRAAQMVDASAVAAAVAAERERCARFAKDWLTRGRSPLGMSLAAAMLEQPSTGDQR